MSKKLSNAIATKFFLHTNDTHHETDAKCCFFSAGDDENGWGFWVRPDGTVDIDEESSNGELPSAKIVAACKRAAMKHLAR
jgi:hypothetical protein